MDDTASRLPWIAHPTEAGGNQCNWCHRMIYLPALPCSIEPVAGLLSMRTREGRGHRCKYELATRRPELLTSRQG